MRNGSARRGRFRAILAVALMLLASAAWLSATPSVASAGASSKRLKVYWVGRHREVTLEYRNATSELAEAKAAHRKARQRKRLQGERRVKLEKELEVAETRYAVAKQEMDAFPDEARRAGAPPGWFR